MVCYSFQLYSVDTPVFKLNQLRQMKKSVLSKDTWYYILTDDILTWNQLITSANHYFLADIQSCNNHIHLENSTYLHLELNVFCFFNQLSSLKWAMYNIKVHAFESDNFKGICKIFFAYKHIIKTVLVTEGTIIFTPNLYNSIQNYEMIVETRLIYCFTGRIRK